MLSLPFSWTRIATKLGFARINRPERNGISYRRVLRFERCEDRRMLSTFTVTNTGDAVANTPAAVGTLRQAIFNANASLEAQDTIKFDQTVFANGGVIHLAQALGELSITENSQLVIDGRNNAGVPLGITIDAGNGMDHMFNTVDGFRIFNIGFSSTGSVEINGLTLTGGDEPDNGGAIRSQTNLTVKNSVITGNGANHGGGIYSNYYSLSIEDCIISDNVGAGNGGGISHTAFSHGGPASLSILSSRITGNEGQGVGGGGLHARVSSGAITIIQSVFDRNVTAPNLPGYRGSGGAYLSADSSTVTITNTIVSNNQALGDESNVGGITLYAGDNTTVTIDGLRVVDNHADDDVGGLLIKNAGSVATVKNSTISGNTATFNNGVSYNAAAGVWLRTLYSGTTTIEYSTISGNKGIEDSGVNAAAGGLFIQNFSGTTTIRNTTVSGNEAQGSGGGIAIYAPGGDVRIRHSTITSNRANSDTDTVGTGGGIRIIGSANPVAIEHAIVAGNFQGTGLTRDDISGAVAAAWSLIGDDSGATITNNGGNQIGTSLTPIDPQLMPLANNGGPTQTHRPRATSPAIDAGNPAAVAGVGGVPTFDQRGSGFPRVLNVPGVHDPGNIVDIGAYEVGPVGLAKVIDVRLSGVMPNGQPWVREPWSFADLVPLGLQHAPIYSAGPNNTSGINKIEVMFSEAVTFAAGQEALALKFLSDNGMPISQTINWGGYDSMTFIATWTLSSPLEDGKYALQVNGVQGPNSTGLDGEWVNFDGPDENTHTPDDFLDDKKLVVLRSGNGVAGGVFELHVSVLPGDYDQNGIVDGADDEPGTVKDGNGDGVIDSADTGIATSNAGAQLPLRAMMGDYNDDEIVTVADYLVWTSTFGNTVLAGTGADGNGNGVVDAADYVNWRNNFGALSAWYDGPAPTAASLVYVDFGNAPRVTNLTISGSISTHAPYLFDAHDGSGEQLRTVPVGGADTVSVTFSEDVNIVAGSLRLVGLYKGGLPEVAEFTYNINTMTATWRFENWFAADQYLISVDDSATDVEGNRLDGEWVNPASLSTVNAAVSEFPSGDGDAGGDFNFVMTILPGDANLNNIFTSADQDIFEDSWVNQLENALFTDGDASGDGSANSSDWYFMPNLGLNLQQLWVLADLNGDFAVDGLDMAILDTNFGISNATHAQGDLNGDGVINNADLNLFFALYGLQLTVVS